MNDERNVIFDIIYNCPEYCGETRAFEVSDIIVDILNKLTAYENTGLTPEEIKELVEKKKNGELVEPPVECKDCCYSWRNNGAEDASNWAPCQRGWSPNEDDFCSYGERIK